jgi:hypothetical protein
MLPGVVGLLMCLVAGTRAQVQVGDQLQINGYASIEFERALEGDAGDQSGSFDMDLFDLVFNFRPTERLRVAADVTWEHGPATEEDYGNVALEYGFAEYRVSNGLTLRAGKVFVPFGIYNEIHTAKPAQLTVKEPLSTNKNHKFGSDARFYPRWAVGVAAMGQTQIGSSPVDYVLLMSNGESEELNPFDEDDNTAKAYTGRVRLHPSPGLSFGASFHYDRLTEFDAAGDDTGGRTSLFSYGAQMQWRTGPVGLELEGVAGSVNPSSGTDVSRWGFSAMTHKTVSQRFTPYIRLEVLDPNTDIDDDMATMWIPGINIQVDRGLFLKAEVQFITSGINNQRFGGLSSTELATSISVGF